MNEVLDFSCVGCAKCCMSDGYVYVTTEDRIRLSDALGIDIKAFTEEYCVLNKGEYHLKDPEKDCCFLLDRKCSLYDARPTQCRTWPDWPENFINGKIQRSAVDYCEGFKK